MDTRSLSLSVSLGTPFFEFGSKVRKNLFSPPFMNLSLFLYSSVLPHFSFLISSHLGCVSSDSIYKVASEVVHCRAGESRRWVSVILQQQQQRETIVMMIMKRVQAWRKDVLPRQRSKGLDSTYSEDASSCYYVGTSMENIDPINLFLCSTCTSPWSMIIITSLFNFPTLRRRCTNFLPLLFLIFFLKFSAFSFLDIIINVVLKKKKKH